MHVESECRTESPKGVAHTLPCDTDVLQFENPNTAGSVEASEFASTSSRVTGAGGLLWSEAPQASGNLCLTYLRCPLAGPG